MEADGEEKKVAAIPTGLNQAPITGESRSDPDSMAMTLWSAAALMESLVLVGGVIWIMSGPGAIGVYARVALVALFAVLGGGAFALAAARKGTKQ